MNGARKPFHAEIERRSTQIVGKRQTRWVGFDDKVIALYARGLSVREIQGHLAEIYGTDVSPDLISDLDQWVAR
jgi:transposase-like protein